MEYDNFYNEEMNCYTRAFRNTSIPVNVTIAEIEEIKDDVIEIENPFVFPFSIDDSFESFFYKVLDSFIDMKNNIALNGISEYTTINAILGKLYADVKDEDKGGGELLCNYSYDTELKAGTEYSLIYRCYILGDSYFDEASNSWIRADKYYEIPFVCVCGESEFNITVDKEKVAFGDDVEVTVTYSIDGKPVSGTYVNFELGLLIDDGKESYIIYFPHEDWNDYIENGTLTKTFHLDDAHMESGRYILSASTTNNTNYDEKEFEFVFYDGDKERCVSGFDAVSLVSGDDINNIAKILSSLQVRVEMVSGDEFNLSASEFEKQFDTKIVIEEISARNDSNYVIAELSFVIDGIKYVKKATVIEAITSGECGENANWTYDPSSRTITITGTGTLTKNDALILFEIIDMFGKGKDLIFSGNVLSLLIANYGFRVVIENGITDVVVSVGEYKDQIVYSDIEFMCRIPFLIASEYKLPISLKEIPAFAFFNNMSVKSITVPGGVEKIGVFAFAQCYKLTDVTLPKSLTDISIAAFFDVTSGLNIHYKGTEDEWKLVNTSDIDYDSIISYYGSEDTKWMPTEKDFAEIYWDSFNYEFGKAPITDDNNDVKIEGEVTGETAEIKEIEVKTEEKKDVVIDLSDQEEVTVITLSEKVIQAINEVISNGEQSFEIVLPETAVAIDKEALASIVEQTGGKPISLNVEQSKEPEKVLNEEQKEALRGENVYGCISAEILCGEEKVSNFGGGVVTITIDFVAPAGKENAKFIVRYIADDGTTQDMETEKNGDKLAFKTGHMSTYVIVEYTEKTPEKQKNGFERVYDAIVNVGEQIREGAEAIGSAVQQFVDNTAGARGFVDEWSSKAGAVLSIGDDIWKNIEEIKDNVIYVANLLKNNLASWILESLN